MITGETIKSAVALAIKSAFAVTVGVPPVTTYPFIYKEKVVQGLQKPRFFVRTLDFSSQKQMNKNYELTYQMNVRYETEDSDSDAYKTLDGVGMKLSECLSSIEVPIGESSSRRVAGSQFSYEVVDGILQVYVTYKVRAYIPDAAEQHLMETLTIIKK